MRKSENLLVSLVFSIILSFVIVFLVTSLLVKNGLLSSSIAQKWLKDYAAEGFVYAMGTENRYFTQTLPRESKPPKFSSILIQFATNLRPGDPRSLLGSEIPGFALYDAEIYIAGKGTDYSTLPIESTPPIYEILRDSKPSEDNKENNRIENPETNIREVVHLYHSHSYEAFKSLSNNGTYNSSNPETNIIAIGNLLKKDLEERGIGVSHDTTNVGEELKAKNWGTGKAYVLARESVKEVLAQKKEITYLIDMHRDSQPRKVTTINIENKSYARLFFVVGKEHPGYERNLQAAENLNRMIEEKYPNLSRGIVIKRKNEGNGIYNQDLTNNAFLIEMGGIDNNMEELVNTSEAFAEVFSEFYWKTEDTKTVNNE